MLGAPDSIPWRQQSLDHASRSSAEELVRRLRGLIGADSIRHTVPGISRRQAAAVKAQTLTVMERERKQTSCRVVVTRPGIMRGFDAIYIRTTEGWHFPLVAADAAVPSAPAPPSPPKPIPLPYGKP